MKDPKYKNLPQENRQTRYCLIGAGILCGLDTYSNEDNYVCITPGTALTSDGSYVELNTAKTFKLYREFKEEGDYPLLNYDLWELIEEQAYIQGDQPLKPQNAVQQLNPFLKDKVVVLYISKKKSTEVVIESNMAYQQNEVEEGVEMETIHFLLIRNNDLLEMLNLDKVVTQMIWDRRDDDDDYIYSDAHSDDDITPSADDLNLATNPALRLKEISLLRFGFAPFDAFTCDEDGQMPTSFPEVKSISDLFHGNPTNEKSGYLQIINNASFQLEQEIEKLINLFHPLLGKIDIFNSEETVRLLKKKCAVLGKKWDAYKNMIAEAIETETIANSKIYYIQYFYDWMRDLINAYEELRCELINLMDECAPDINKFACHLLLGIPKVDNIVNIPNPLRQSFQQPPIYNGNAARRQKVKLYFWRMVKMIGEFYLPHYLPEKTIYHCNKNIDSEADFPEFSTIKITPGKFYDKPISEQTIPYYYPVSYNDHSVHHCWNYKRTRSSKTDRILSYHANGSEDSYSELDEIMNPLHYNLDQYDFYRIEGHIGQTFAKNLTSKKGEGLQIHLGIEAYLTMLIKKYNLDFSVLYFDLNGSSYTNQFSSPDDYEYEEKNLFNYWCKKLREQDKFNRILGMEHLAGVRKGGTFIILHENGKVVADFSLPYRLHFFEENKNNANNETRSESELEAAIKAAEEAKRKEEEAKKKAAEKAKEKEKAATTPQDRWGNLLTPEERKKKEDLTTIKGIGKETAITLNTIGATSIKHLSVLTKKDWVLLNKENPKISVTKGVQWSKAAKELIN